ncbi:MAG TPA: biotin--[acetyl-CoA-carboxylase] ligase [Parvularculaceae bacterium]|nr:biotin--[acetyl-CoA-carboxylase] ligase [Parvularculaceae bacterium]
MAKTLSSGARLALYETLDSTNAEARRRAAAGERGPLWIVAIEQIAGYGRRGAPWKQSAGDVAATLLFAPAAPVETLGQLSFVAALAVAETIADLARRARVELKWPNDVLLGGGKIAGILLELIDATAGAPLVALGVGVNIVSRPEADYPTARLIDALMGEPSPSPQDVVARLDAAVDQWLRRWRGEGFSPVRSAWLEKAVGLGGEITVRLPGETIEGVFRDLDPTGALVLECEGRRRLISAGAVFPARAPRQGA